MQPQRIVVVGAGLAGLAAAHELATRGAAVTILEARDRAGGRVWTVRSGFAAGQHGELGGEFIDADHERMRQLATRFDLPIVRVLERGFASRYRAPHRGYRLTRSGPWEMLRRRMSPLIARYRAVRGRDDAAALREIATWSVRDWLEREQAPPEEIAAATTIRGFFLADPAELSVLPVVAQLAGSGPPAQTPLYRILGGNDRLIDALIARTPARLLLQHAVRSVTQPSDRVLVRATDERGLLQQIECDAVVMTVPTTALRAIEINPPLPEEQENAIARLRYGCATKAVVQCAGAGLRERRLRAVATDGPLGAFWDATEGQPSTGHSVMAFLGAGTASAPMQQLTDHGPVGLLSELCWLGLAGTPVLASHRVTWEDDPFALGGYAYADPAFDPAWKPLLSRRAGRIVFAGEHTSADYQGYMEGAVESGERAARELLG